MELVGRKGLSRDRLFYAATLERNRSTEERSSAAWRERSFAERRIKSAERVAFSFAAAVPAMPRATFAVPAAACRTLSVISAAAAFCRFTALAIVAVKASISFMTCAIAATLSAARLVAGLTPAILGGISSAGLAGRM